MAYKVDVQLMLADQYQQKRIQQWPVIVEPKIDGTRVIVVCERGEVWFPTRNGNHMVALEHLAPIFQNLADTYDSLRFDGEVAVPKAYFTEGSGLVRRHEPALEAVIHLFDIQMPGGLEERKHALLDLAPNDEEGKVGIVPWAWANDFEDIERIYQDYVRWGHEGAMVKIPDGTYLFRRHWYWMKMKGKETHEVCIEDAEEGEGKYVGALGAFICGTYDKFGDRTGRVKVGGGYDDPTRFSLWATWLTNPELLKGRWVEVECQLKTRKGSLRHPNFLKFRDDK